jgi:hypothetical protein
MCQAWTHLSPLSQIEVGRTSEQGRTRGKLVSIQCQHVKPTQTVQDQEETYLRSWSKGAPMGWNWYLASRHTKECLEAATQESCKEQAQQELIRQQAQ